MDVFAEIADERRSLAALLSGLPEDQQAAPSLCSEWQVRDVVGHLVVPLEVSTPRFVLAVLARGGDFDRANVRLAREQARRPWAELVEVLRRKAGSRFTPPGSGPEAPLTDLLVHGLDIRRPLGLAREVPAERLRTALAHVTSARGRVGIRKGALTGLQFAADDVDWAHGAGPPVRGSAEALLLAVTGRATALDQLSGDGVPLLRSRLG